MRVQWCQPPELLIGEGDDLSRAVVAGWAMLSPFKSSSPPVRARFFHPTLTPYHFP